MLRLPEGPCSGHDVVAATLRMNVDLLWAGGIGTYVKSSNESHADVRDRPNDSVRVDADELGAKVIGEGANLAVTQEGRVQFSLLGGKVNTDALDNACGVACSDHEVNLKILLGKAMQAEMIDEDERRRVLRKMERTICLPDLVPEIQEVRKMGGFDLFDLEDLFEMIASAGLTIVLLLDEFEYVTQNPNFGSDFFGGLRALAIHQNLPLVTATRRELVDLCHSDEIKGSPFFNIFANVVLRPFSREEVYRMLDGYLVETALSFSPQEKELVIGLGGGYPFFIQMAGNYLVDAKQKGYEGDELLREVYASFDAQADSHFTYMWSHSSESEKITLLAVISLDRQKATKKNTPSLENLAAIHSRAHLDVPELVKRGLLLENRAAGTYRLLSPSLERWIAREISAAPGEEESQASVQAWLAAGGREEMEPVSGLLPKFKKKYWPVVSGMAMDLSLELIGAVTWEILTKGAL